MTADPLEPRGLRRGWVPAPAALAATLVLTVAAGWLDLRLFGGTGRLVATVFVLGSVLTVLVVRHRGVPLVMLSAPLVPIIGMLVPALLFTAHDASTTVLLLSAARPVIVHFPAVAGTTVLVLALGALRLVLNRRATAMLTR